MQDNRCSQHYMLNEHHRYHRVLQRIIIEAETRR
jgi:hypothetical protein